MRRYKSVHDVNGKELSGMPGVKEKVTVEIRGRASKQDSEFSRPVNLGSLLQPHLYK
jgi:hypothetical protein